MNQQDLTQCSFSESIIADSWTICGVVLKPFCLGHIIMLEAVNNPLIKGEAEVVAGEDALCFFFLALLICSLSYEDNLELFNNSEMLGKTCKELCDHIVDNMKLDSSWNVYYKVNLFKKYMASFLESMPFYNECQESKGGEIPSGADWKSSIFVTFKKLGYTETEILNMNIKKLFTIWAQYAESEGAIKIANKFEAEQLRRITNMKKGRGI